MSFSATFDTAWGSAAGRDSELATLRRLDSLARLLDSAFAIPGIGTRIGADALLNLVPGAGLVVAKGLSAYLVWEAWRLGVPKPLITKMVANVGVDLAISAVPFAGWVGDVFFRANMRNMTLLRGHLAGRHGPAAGPSRRSRDPVTIDGEIVRADPR